MKCFVSECGNESIYDRGGFCEDHWRVLGKLERRRLDAARLALREARFDAMRYLDPRAPLR
jgi:hypothetical protein